ncbi:MAG: PfkB family carbohydrate kinase [Eubacteriales bacterium]|nr:PfkB family carbohydrate kinase [Eubacteriales bacterium]
MKRLLAIGEALIDFIPHQTGVAMKDVESFSPLVGGTTGETNPERALPKLFTGNVKLVVYTEGAEGARAYTKNARASAQGVKVTAVDTTGAGDGFVGAFLYQMYRDGVTADSVDSLTEKRLEAYLDFSNRYCARSVMAKGGLPSYPTVHEM